MVNHEWSLAQLTAKAEAYCAAAEHCIFDVRQKLQQWGATEEQIKDILTHLEEARFVDEQRYCCAFIHDKLLYQGWGCMKMRAQLQAKHLPSAAIKQALDGMDKEVYQATLEKIIIGKQRSLKNNDPHLREKIIRFCLQRGFTYEEITAYIRF